MGLRLLASRLERAGQGVRRVGDRRVPGDEFREAVAGAGHVELLNRSIEPAPEIVGTAPASAGAKLIGRPRSVGARHRSPSEPGFERARVSVAHRRGSLGQGSQATAKLRIGRRQLMRAHRTRPRRLSFAHAVPGGLLAGRRRSSPMFGSLHDAFLSHQPAVEHGCAIELRRGKPLVALKTAVANTHRRCYTTILV
jgi:hypothetical protein